MQEKYNLFFFLLTKTPFNGPSSKDNYFFDSSIID